MEKKLTENTLKRLIKESIEEFEDIECPHFDKEEFPDFFDEFLGTLGQDFLGYDYPSNDDDEGRRFDIFMKFNHPEVAPSAQSQVGYDDADSVEEIGDGPEDEDVFEKIGLSESKVRQIAAKVLNEVMSEQGYLKQVSKDNDYQKAKKELGLDNLKNTADVKKNLYMVDLATDWTQSIPDDQIKSGYCNAAPGPQMKGVIKKTVTGKTKSGKVVYGNVYFYPQTGEFKIDGWYLKIAR